MSESNGTTVVIPGQHDRDPYRPTASTAKVQQTIEVSLREVVSEAANQAGSFAYLAWADRAKGVEVQYGHLVDATECLETAMTYLGMLRQVLSHRMRIEDDQNIGSVDF